MKKKIITLLLTGTCLCSLTACGATATVTAGTDTPIPTRAVTSQVAPETEPTKAPATEITTPAPADYTTDMSGWFYQPETEDTSLQLLNVIGAQKYGTAGASLSREAAATALMDLAFADVTKDALRGYFSGMNATQADFFSFQWQMAMKDALVSDAIISLNQLVTDLLSEQGVTDLWKENLELEPFFEWSEGKTILPLPVTIDMEHLDNCSVAVSFDKGDAYVDDTGIMRLKVKVYAYDLFDMVDIARLAEGDTILLHGEEVVITTLTRTETGAVQINGGLDNGGYELITDESTVFFETGYSDAKAYCELGEAELRVSTEFIFNDSMDLDKGEVTYYPGDFLTDEAGIVYYFTPDNTSIVIQDGQVIAMKRVYTP